MFTCVQSTPLHVLLSRTPFEINGEITNTIWRHFTFLIIWGFFSVMIKIFFRLSFSLTHFVIQKGYSKRSELYMWAKPSKEKVIDFSFMSTLSRVDEIGRGRGSLLGFDSGFESCQLCLVQFVSESSQDFDCCLLHYLCTMSALTGWKLGHRKLQTYCNNNTLICHWANKQNELIDFFSPS